MFTNIIIGDQQYFSVFLLADTPGMLPAAPLQKPPY